MSIDQSKQLEDALGLPVRKLDPTEIPPEIRFLMEFFLGIDINNLYTPDCNNSNN